MESEKVEVTALPFSNHLSERAKVLSRPSGLQAFQVATGIAIPAVLTTTKMKDL
jgi:hypothetical protein